VIVIRVVAADTLVPLKAHPVIYPAVRQEEAMCLPSRSVINRLRIYRQLKALHMDE
jgi:hypothetical protein